MDVSICHLEPCNQDAQYDTKYLVPKYLVPSTWAQIFRTKYLVPMTWSEGLGTEYLVPNALYRILGTWYPGQDLVLSTQYQVSTK